MDLVSSSDIFLPYNRTNVFLYKEFEESEIIIKIGRAAAKIAYHNFKWQFITLVMYNTMLHIGVETFLRYYNKNVILNLGKTTTRHLVHVRQFVVFGQETAEIIDNLQWLLTAKYDNTGLYILICTSSNYEKCNENDLFLFLSTHYFVNSIFLKKSKDYNEFLVYAYHPILPGKCRNSLPFQLKLKCENDYCFKKLYPERLNNLHRCPFVVSTIHQPPFMYLHNPTGQASGGDADIIKMVAEILNATLVLIESFKFGQYENNNWTGSLGDVFNKRADSSMCAAPLTPEIHGNFQISFTYNSNDIVWAARLPMLKPSWEKLFYPLKVYTRISLFFMFIIIIWVNTFTKTKMWKKICNTLNTAASNVSLFFYAWVVFFGIPVIKMPSKSTMRTIIVCWIWFCYIIRTAYQAALVSSMRIQEYENFMVNFHEVITNKFPYGGMCSLRGYYVDDPAVFSNWIHVGLTDSYHILDSILNGSSTFVIALNKKFIIHHMTRYKGTKLLQILPKKIVNSPTALYFKKFNPFRPPINRVLSMMIENGLIDIINARYLNSGKYFFKQNKELSIKALSLVDVSSSFVILFLGWSLSIIYFLLEIFKRKM